MEYKAYRSMMIMLALLSVVEIGSAQKVLESFQFIAKYNLRFVNDTNNRDKFVELTYYMQVDPKISSWWPAILHDDVFEEETAEEQVESAPVIESDITEPEIVMGGACINFNAMGIVGESIFFYFNQSDKFFEFSSAIPYYYRVEHKLPLVDWHLSKDTTTFYSMKCKKARGRLGGRNYTVLYTEELPYPYGPWKLNGLPGMILYAIDDKNEVEYKIDSIFRLSGVHSESDFLSLSGYHVPTSEKKLKKIRKQYLADPVAFTKSVSGQNVFVEKRYIDGAQYISYKQAPPDIKRKLDDPKLFSNNQLELD